MGQETAEPESLASLLLRSKQGKMLLGMGFLYTVIVSATLIVFYMATTPLITVLATCGYILFTALMVYTRTPSPKLIPAAFLVFTVIPVVVTGTGIAALIIVGS